MRNTFFRIILTVAASLMAVPLSAQRLLPPAPPASDYLVVVDWQVRSQQDQLQDLSVRTLQGLVNRDKARVWVGTEMREGSAGWWMQKYRDMNVVKHQPQVISREQFLRRYSLYARGVVVPPSNLGPGGYRVAVMRAAADDLIVGSRELADQLNLPVVEDYSTRFKTYAESWRYALDNLWDRLSGAGAYVDREDLATGTYTSDYVVQHKLFLCAPHVDGDGEMDLLIETLSRLPLNAPVLGAVGGRGLYNEGDLVRAVSRAGCVFLGCESVPNLSIHGSLNSPVPYIQPMRKAPELDKTKAYVAVELSDGDNASVFFKHIPRRNLWDQRGQVPAGWTMGQGVLELAPAMAAYYYSTRTPLDEFITGVSGYAYMFPGDFGDALSPAKAEEAWRIFLDRTDTFLKISDQRVITTIHYQADPGPLDAATLGRYAALENITGIINGYNAVYQEYGGKTWEIIDGLPVFHTLTDRTWSEPGQRTLADDVIERTPEERPAFVALFMLPMALGGDHFEQVVASLKRLEQEGYVLVLPSELADLAKQHAATRSP